MNEGKMLELQMQMRNNNSEYKDFLDDMESWVGNLKNKEKKCNNSSGLNKLNQVPHIRNTCNTEKKETKEAKIKGYDYKSWDKYDVNKALEEIDDKVDVKTEEANKFMLAEQCKERGNLYFKEGNYLSSINEYTQAIKLNPSNDILYTNRAMSFIKLGDYAAGEIDCTEAIKLKSNSVKSYYRRAKCRILLNERKKEALEDLKTVLKLEPNNKLALKELKELESELNVRGVVEPLWKPPKDKLSKKPLLKIEITDVNPNKSYDTIYNHEKPMEIPIPKTEVKESFEGESKINFKIPQTSVQLSKDLCNFRKNSKNLAIYVASLDRKSYKKLIGHALDCELLVDLINGLSFARQYQLITDEDFVSSINALHSVPRFSSSWFMLSGDEKLHFNETVASFDINLIDKLLVKN